MLAFRIRPVALVGVALVMQMPEVAEQALNLWPAGDGGAAAVTLVAVALVTASAVCAAAAAAVSEQAW